MIRLSSIFVLAMMVYGCAQQAQVSVPFATEVEVDAGNNVWFGQDVIGEVERVAKQDSGTRVFLSLDPDKIKSLKKGAAAMVVRRDGATGIEIFDFRSGQQPLSGSDELTALNNGIEYIAWQSREAMDFSHQALSAFTTSMQNYFDSEEWQQQKEAMEQSLTKMGDDAQAAVMEIQRNYEAMAKELQDQSEQNRAEIERKFKETAAVLQQQIKELLQSGEAALADSLQQFLDMLEQMMKQSSERKEQQKTSGSPA